VHEVHFGHSLVSSFHEVTTARVRGACLSSFGRAWVNWLPTSVPGRTCISASAPGAHNETLTHHMQPLTQRRPSPGPCMFSSCLPVKTAKPTCRFISFHQSTLSILFLSTEGLV
jgi:hypothetical protein